MEIMRPGKIGNLTIKNRIIMSPMNVGALNNSDGSLSERGIDYFVERAKGGVGLIVTGAVRVTREFERSKDTIPLWMLFADHKIHTAWINELSERCHDYNCKVAVQLTIGGGRQAGAFAQNHGLAIGPSELRCFYYPHKNTRPLTKDEIKKFLQAIEFSASIVKEAGADAIQLHGHEGYLMDQFTTSLFNHRKDCYGGSLENCLRFIKEIIEAIRKGAGEDFPIIYRFGLSHFIPGGRTIDEGLKMASLLEKYGVDALDIDAGCYENWYLPHPPTTIKAGSLSYLAAKTKEVVKIPVITSGKIHYPSIAEKIIKNDEADFISLGRPLIADSNWVEKAKNGKEEEIRPCIACHEGCLKRIGEFKSISCAVNPAAGNEKYLTIEKAKEQKRVLVVGGGIAGMVSALVADKRGHIVMLIEKSDELGGNFKKGFIPEFKNDYMRYIKYLTNLIRKSGIELLLNHSFEKADYYSFNPDEIILATGARFKKLELQGIETVKQLQPLDCFKEERINGSAVVIGGGLVGVEAALSLSLRGAEVTLISHNSYIAKDCVSPNRQHIIKLLKENKVRILTETKPLKVEKGRLLYEKIPDQKYDEINVDFISSCVGMVPDRKVKNLLDSMSVSCIEVGDCDNPGKVLNAVWNAFRRVRLL